VSHWRWQYSPDAGNVIGGLTPEQVADVEAEARRITDKVAAERIGAPDDEQEAASGLEEHFEGQVFIWYQKWYLRDTVLIMRVLHLGAD
jgi:hypothetical protein